MAAWTITAVVFGVAFLNLAMSNGNVNAQQFGVFLLFRVFFILCGIDALLFVASVIADLATKSRQKVGLWPYLLFFVVVALFLLMPLLLVGRMW
jgi:H+/Cl- antiporter ClcA